MVHSNAEGLAEMATNLGEAAAAEKTEANEGRGHLPIRTTGGGSLVCAGFSFLRHHHLGAPILDRGGWRCGWRCGKKKGANARPGIEGTPVVEG